MATVALCSAAGIAIILSLSPAKRNWVILTSVGSAASLVNLQFGSIHVFTILIFGWSLLQLSRRVSMTFPITFLLLTVAFVATSVIAGDLATNPLLAVQMLLLATSAVLLALFTTSAERLTVMKGALGMIVLSGSYGIGQLAGIFPSREHVLHLDVSEIGRPSGFWPEPDWLGMYCAIGLVLAWRLPLARWQRVIALPICGLMWVLSFARAAWIALIVTAIVGAIVVVISRNGKAKHGRGRIAALVVTAAALAAPIYFLPSLTDNLIVRLQRTLTVRQDDISGEARLQQLDGLWYLARHSPWHGHGLSAAGRVGVSGNLYLDEAGSANSVASNWVLGLWVDARLLAVPFILLIFALTVFCLQHTAGQVLSIIIVSSFFSNATFVPIFWLAVGLCLAVVSNDRQVYSIAGSNQLSRKREVRSDVRHADPGRIRQNL